MDIILIFIPPIIYSLLKLRKLKGLYIIIAGFSPFLLWECFSIFYYGFPFPNTAYAKAFSTGIPRIDLISQGFYYFLNSLKMDPLTLSTITIGIILSFLSKNWAKTSVILGVIFYLFYILWIGGCFMSGRLFTPPLLCAVILVSSYSINSKRHLFSYIMGIIIVIIIRISFPYLSSNKRENIVFDHGIVDERRFYYQTTGLLKAKPGVEMPIDHRAKEGKKARKDSSRVILRGSIGFFGFYAGPYIHIIDIWGLSDALLARLPVKGEWRVGHYTRIIPNGYINTLLCGGKNMLKNKYLATYYEKISLITRGKLFSIKRLIEIWNMNVGKYNYLIKLYPNYPDKVKLFEVSTPKNEGTVWNHISNFIISNAGIEIDLEKKYYSKSIEISLDHNDAYKIIYFYENLKIGEQIIHPSSGCGLKIYSIQVPQEVSEKGYDMIKIVPVSGDNLYSIGHLILLE
jgi:arabinofuranosyltransferase